MPKFQFKAKNRTGELITDSLVAADRRSALAELGRQGYFPLTVEATAEKEATAARRYHWRQRVTQREVMLFTQQLTTLLRSGMSLAQALEALARRAQKASVRDMLGAVHNDILQGETLSAALAKHRPLFSDFHINLVKAGEASGTLSEVLARLIKHYERAAELREKVTGALIYPAIIVTVGIGTIIFFMLVMVPRFATMFREMGRTMPLPTRVLIAISDGCIRYWPIGVAAVVAVVVIYRYRVRSESGRLALDGWKLRLPVVGGVTLANALGQFAQTLATLLENGVPVLGALQIVEETMTNRVVARELHEARARVTDGTSLSQPLAKGKVFPPLMLDMLAVGEESGEVVPALKNIAEMYEQELTRRLRLFTTLLEPVIILVMALVVGGVVLSILLAVFDITSGIGK
jgi:type II secretory pathway component PulF